MKNNLRGKKNGRRGSLQSTNSAAMSVNSYGTVISTAQGGHIRVDDMNEDLCYIIIIVIERLIEETMRKDAATHSRSITGIVSLLESHKLYLDVARFDRLLKAVCVAMETMKPGDAAAIKALFNNSQFRHYLMFNLDPSWENRRVDIFIKHEKLQRALKLKGGKTRKDLSVEDTREAMLEKILLLSGKNNVPELVVDLYKHGVSGFTVPSVCWLTCLRRIG